MVADFFSWPCQVNWAYHWVLKLEWLVASEKNEQERPNNTWEAADEAQDNINWFYDPLFLAYLPVLLPDNA